MKPRAGRIKSTLRVPVRPPARPHVRLSDTTRTGAARVLRAPGRQEVGDIGRRAFVADEVADEAARKPASKPFSVSPCLPALRVNRPEAREEREAFHHVEQEYNPRAYFRCANNQYLEAEYSSRRTGASHCWR